MVPKAGGSSPLSHPKCEMSVRSSTRATIAVAVRGDDDVVRRAVRPHHAVAADRQGSPRSRCPVRRPTRATPADRAGTAARRPAPAASCASIGSRRGSARTSARSSSRVHSIVALTSSGSDQHAAAAAPSSTPRRVGFAADVVLDDPELAVVEHRPDGSAHRTDPPRELAPGHELGAMGPRPDEQQRVGGREHVRRRWSGHDVDARHERAASFGARISTSPSTVLTPTSSTSGCAAAHSSAIASSGSSPTSVSIQQRTVSVEHGAQAVFQRRVSERVARRLEARRASRVDSRGAATRRARRRRSPSAGTTVSATRSDGARRRRACSVNSAFTTGDGATTFTAPDNDSVLDRVHDRVRLRRRV